MEFAKPFYLLFLWITPLIIILYIFSLKKKIRLLRLFAKEESLKKISDFSSQNVYFFKASLLIIASIFSILALAEPKFGYKWQEVIRKGTDIVVAVDVSKSMLARDIQPDRLERAKRKLQDLLNILNGDRIALVAFAGTSFLQSPLTLDYDAFRLFLDYLNPSLIPIPGTAISNALESAYKAFPEDSARSKSIILITDGEDHQQSMGDIIDTLKRNNIQVFVIGIGNEEGAPIPDDQGSYKKDSAGNLIMTKLHSEVLKKIADETNGKFVRSVSGDFDLQKIYFEGIKKNAMETEFSSGKKKILQERFQVFAAIALLLICIEFLVSEKSRKNRMKVK